MLTKLKAHIAKNGIAQVRKEWAEIEKIQFDGPFVFSYLEYLNEKYPVGSCFEPPSNILFPENMAPNFSGSFFLCNIAA